MSDGAAATAISNLDLSKVVLAIGSLGTAAYGVVDASKCFGGGISKCGIGDIETVVSQFIPRNQVKGLGKLAFSSIHDTLRANWMNGMALADQKSVAKALIKLNLDPGSAQQMAEAAGVDPAILKAIAVKLPTATPLSATETDVYGRFDLMLSALLDQGYQRADQRYRNAAKLAAVPVAVILALLGAWALDGTSAFHLGDAGRAVLAGLLATPLAPIAKDLSTAIQAAAQLAQSWKSGKK